MTTPAIIMLVISIASVWGGLVASVAYLVTHPLEEK
ncbi:methionine/alanine import family NSS transporter small subunit [Trueperella sp. LYQ143]